MYKKHKRRKKRKTRRRGGAVGGTVGKRWVVSYEGMDSIICIIRIRG